MVIASHCSFNPMNLLIICNLLNFRVFRQLQDIKEQLHSCHMENHFEHYVSVFWKKFSFCLFTCKDFDIVSNIFVTCKPLYLYEIMLLINFWKCVYILGNLNIGSVPEGPFWETIEPVWYCLWSILLFNTKYLLLCSLSLEFFTVSKWDVCFSKDLLNGLSATVSG